MGGGNKNTGCVVGFGGNKNTESVGGSSDVTLYGNESKEFFHSTRKKK